MHFIQPKPYMDRLRLRNHAKGVERRKNMSKIILEKINKSIIQIAKQDEKAKTV